MRTVFEPNVTPLRYLHRSHLGADAARLYDEISEALAGGRRFLEFRADESEDFSAAVLAVQGDDPNFYKLDRRRFITLVTSGGSTEAELHFFYEPERLEEIGRLLDRTVSRIVGMCGESCSTDYEKELFVHDYLANNVEYDRSSNAYDHAAQTQVGALLEGRAVCEGISKAAALLLQEAGVDCGCLFNREHMWNVIRLDGEYYHLDVTWDLRDGYRNMDFFNLTDAVILRDSDHDHRVGPPCTGTEYNWYRRNGRYFRSEDEIVDAVRAFASSGEPFMDFRYEGVSDSDAKGCVDHAFRTCGDHPGYRVVSSRVHNTFHIIKTE